MLAVAVASAATTYGTTWSLLASIRHAIAPLTPAQRDHGAGDAIPLAMDRFDFYRRWTRPGDRYWLNVRPSGLSSEVTVQQAGGFVARFHLLPAVEVPSLADATLVGAGPEAAAPALHGRRARAQAGRLSRRPPCSRPPSRRGAGCGRSPSRPRRPVAVVAPWRIWVAAHGIGERDYSLGNALDPGYLDRSSGRVGPAAGELLRQIADTGKWGLLVPLVAAAVAAAVVLHRRAIAAFAVAWLVLAFGGLVVVYWISTLPLASHLDNSSYRTIDSLILGGAALVPVLVGRVERVRLRPVREP